MLSPVLAQGSEQFTSELWAAVRGIYAQTLEHPFLKGLADGTLSRGRFQFYLQQDALYLRAFSQALNTLASKAPREDWALTLSRHAIESIETERQLHDSILKAYGAAAVTEMAPVNAAYTNHLLAAVSRESFGHGLAAVLPCYWIYWEVGKDLKKRGSKDPDYQKWINQYADPAYGASVRAVLAMMDSEGLSLSDAGKAKARELFVRSARYEWMFWDMAWREEKWFPR
jgi:thiaminase/transcriptional activator TenA